MSCMRCMLVVVIRPWTLVVPSFDTVVYPWEPGIREHPIFLHDTLTPTFFCTGILVSYWNRNVAVAPFPLSLSWHPFRFRHDDKCFLICSYQLIHKYCIKLVHVIRIMITTIKMFKLLLHQIDKCIWGFTGFVICYVRPHLNCLDGVVLLCFTFYHVEQHLILLGT